MNEMKAIVCGANGAMGQLLLARLGDRATGLVSADGENNVPKTFEEMGPVNANVVIDFSHHSAAQAVTEYAKKTGAVVTVENHNYIGGLYSAVAECLAAKYPVPMGRVAVEDEFGEVGPVDYLAERFGLTVEHIVQAVEDTIIRE